MKDNQQPSSVYKELPENPNYLIYADGRVFNQNSNRFLTGKIDELGYKICYLSVKNELGDRRLCKKYYIHLLVAKLFLDNPNQYQYVRHKNKNKLNNTLENLEWISAQDFLNCLKQESYKPKYIIKDLENEKWQVIPNHLNYSISSYGRIRNNRTNRLLKYDENQKYIQISFDNKEKLYLHRLVYCIFNNDYDLNGFEIIHVDGNLKNNKLENLKKQKRFND